MADIDDPRVLAGLDEDALRLKREIRLDEAKLRLKKLEVSKIDHYGAIKKIDLEMLNLTKEIDNIEKEDEVKKK